MLLLGAFSCKVWKKTLGKLKGKVSQELLVYFYTHYPGRFYRKGQSLL